MGGKGGMEGRKERAHTMIYMYMYMYMYIQSCIYMYTCIHINMWYKGCVC